MFSMAKHRVLHVWIALLAILFGALAPAVSHALAAADRHAGQVELCTATGVQLVEVPAPDSKQTLPPMHDMGHCACCTSHHALHALPSSSAAIAVTGGRAIHPALFHAAPRLLHAWSPAAPRGPPLFA